MKAKEEEADIRRDGKKMSKSGQEWTCLWCDAFVVTVLSDEPRQNQGRGLVDHKLVKAPQ